MAGGAFGVRRSDLMYNLSSVPKKRKVYKYKREGFGKLDRKKLYDSGGTYDLFNVDTSSYPALRSARSINEIYFKHTGNIVAFSVCDGICYTLLFGEGNLYLGEYDPRSGSYFETLVAEEQEKLADGSYSLVRFNEFSSHTDPIRGEYTKKMLVLPVFAAGEIGRGGEAVFEQYTDVPPASVATVFMSRVFCADKGKLFASEFNDPGGFRFDTADESLDSNAWMSNTQSNTKADGDITALAVYDGHVVVFKKDYMMQVYNNKNPFRLVEIGSFGCISKDAVCEFDGKLAFIDSTGVMLYSGGYPYRIGEELGVEDWSGAKLCASGKLLFVYLPSENTVFVYDAEHDCWGNRNARNVKLMSADHTGAYYIAYDRITRLDDGTPPFFSILTDKSSLGYDGKKRVCGFGCEAVVGEDSYLTISMVDSDFESYCEYVIREPGEHFIKKKIKGQSMKYCQFLIMGQGEVSISSLSVDYRREDEDA